MQKFDGMFKPAINKKLISVFCRQLHIILKSGVNILNGLDIVRDQLHNKTLRKLVDKLFDDVQKGLSLSEAMADSGDLLPPLLVNMVSVGELSGNLDEILGQMAVYYEKENYMKDKLSSALTYPVILLSAAVIMVVFFLNFVMPEILGLLTDSGGDLPLLTRIVIAVSNFLRNYFLVISGIVIIILIAVRAAVPLEKRRRKLHSLLNKTPVLGVSIRNVVTSRFTRTASMMLRGGIPILFVLEAVGKVLNNSIAEIGIKAAVEGVKRGERLGDNIASCGYFDPMVTHMINIGEETGQLDSILESMADFYDKEAETSLMKMMSMVEPAFTILVGIFIGILIIAMVIPMFNMIDKINV
jgi:type IV pilus assembly protein PilC